MSFITHFHTTFVICYYLHDCQKRFMICIAIAALFIGIQSLKICLLQRNIYNIYVYLWLYSVASFKSIIIISFVIVCHLKTCLLQRNIYLSWLYSVSSVKSIIIISFVTVFFFHCLSSTIAIIMIP